jgi:hypothetical protein
MEAQDPTPKIQQEELGPRLKTLSRAFEDLVDRTGGGSRRISVWSGETITMVKHNTAKGLWNAAEQLQRAARKLDDAAHRLVKPVTNGQHTPAGSTASNGMDDEVIAPPPA